MVNFAIPDEIKSLSEFYLSKKQSQKGTKQRNWYQYLYRVTVAVILLTALGGTAYAWQKGYLNPYLNFSLSPNTKGSATTSSSGSPSAQVTVSIDQALANTQASFGTSGKLDKGRVAFVRDGAIWVVDSSGEKKLTNLSAKTAFPIISSDASKIFYAEYTLNTPSKIHVINIDGTADKAITDHSQSLYPFDLSGDNKSILSLKDTSTQSNLSYVLHVVDSNGKEVRSLNPISAWGASCSGSGYFGAETLVENDVGFKGSIKALDWMNGNNYLLTTNCATDHPRLLSSDGKLIDLPDDMRNPKPSLDYDQFVGVGSKSLYYFNADGSLVKKISLDSSPLYAILSVDKKFIFFVTRSSVSDLKDKSGALVTSKYQSTVWKIGVDGSSLAKAFDEDSYLIVPRSFSGDGSLLIYDRISNDYDFLNKIEQGIADTKALSAIAPRSDIYMWNSTNGDRTKVIENGYQADYTSR